MFTLQTLVDAYVFAMVAVIILCFWGIVGHIVKICLRISAYNLAKKTAKEAAAGIADKLREAMGGDHDHTDAHAHFTDHLHEAGEDIKAGDAVVLNDKGQIVKAGGKFEDEAPHGFPFPSFMEAMKTGIDLAKKNGDKSVVMQFKPDGKGGMEMVKHSSVPKTPVVKKPARKPAAKKAVKKVAAKKPAPKK